ncbi:hypothetical protein IAR50_004308 [Cryptococcus sp. DSM 104548]
MPPKKSSRRKRDRSRENSNTDEPEAPPPPPPPAQRPPALQTPVDRLKQRLRVRQSLTKSGLLSRDITRRAVRVSVAAETFLQSLYEGEGTVTTWDALNYSKARNIFPPHAPPFPSYEDLESALHPDIHDTLDRDSLFRAVQLSNLSTLLFSIYSPDEASDRFLPFDLEEEDEDVVRSLSADRMRIRTRVRRRNYVWEKGWKMFWTMVVPIEKRDNERAIRLWLDFATQIHLRYRCPSITDDASDDLPEISGILDNDFFSESAILRFGQWVLSDDADDEDAAKKSRVSRRWERMARKRREQLRHMSFEEAVEEFGWDDFRDGLLEWVNHEVLTDEDNSVVRSRFPACALFKADHAVQFTPSPRIQRRSLVPLSAQSRGILSPVRPRLQLPGPLNQTMTVFMSQSQEEEEEEEEEERAIDQVLTQVEIASQDSVGESGQDNPPAPPTSRAPARPFLFNSVSAQDGEGAERKSRFKFNETQDDREQIEWESQSPERVYASERKAPGKGKGKGKAKMVEKSEEESLRSEDDDSQSLQSYTSEYDRQGGVVDVDGDEDDDPDDLYFDVGQTDPPVLQDVKPSPPARRTTRAMSRAQSETPAPAPVGKGKKRKGGREVPETSAQAGSSQPTKKARRAKQPTPILTETESELESEADTLATQSSTETRQAPGPTPSPAPSSLHQEDEPTPRPRPRPSAQTMAKRDADEVMEEEHDLAQLLTSETKQIPSQPTPRSKRSSQSRKDPRRINEDTATYDVDHESLFESLDTHEKKKKSSKGKGKERAREETVSSPSPPPASSPRAASKSTESSRPARYFRVGEAGPSRISATSDRSPAPDDCLNPEWNDQAFMGDDMPMAAPDDYDAQGEAMRENGFGDEDERDTEEEEEEEKEEDARVSEDRAYASASSDSEADLNRLRAANKAKSAEKQKQVSENKDGGDTGESSDASQSSAGSSRGRDRLNRPDKKPRPPKKTERDKTEFKRKPRKYIDPDNDPGRFEDGHPLKPFPNLDMPVNYRPDIPRAKLQAIWSDELSWLLYRTVQKCPAWVPYPLRAAWYLHGDNGRDGQELRGFDMAQMKSRMEELINIRLNSGVVIEGNARAFARSAALKKKLGWDTQKEKERVRKAQLKNHDREMAEEEAEAGSETESPGEEDENTRTREKKSRKDKASQKVARPTPRKSAKKKASQKLSKSISTNGCARKTAQTQATSNEEDEEDQSSNAEAGPSRGIGTGKAMNAKGKAAFKNIGWAEEAEEKAKEEEEQSESTVVGQDSANAAGGSEAHTRSSLRLPARRPYIELPPGRTRSSVAKKPKTSEAQQEAENEGEDELDEEDEMDDDEGKDELEEDEEKDDLEEEEKEQKDELKEDEEKDELNEDEEAAGEAAELPPAGQRPPTQPDSSAGISRAGETPYPNSSEANNRDARGEQQKAEEQQEAGEEQAGDNSANETPRSSLWDLFSRNY